MAVVTEAVDMEVVDMVEAETLEMVLGDQCNNDGCSLQLRSINLLLHM